MRVTCNKDCRKCKYLWARTDDKGYPFGYYCNRIKEDLEQADFERSKIFHK